MKEKIIIVGSGGAGSTTLAKMQLQLKEKLGNVEIITANEALEQSNSFKITARPQLEEPKVLLPPQPNGYGFQKGGLSKRAARRKAMRR